jgi:hypothetical protein
MTKEHQLDYSHEDDQRQLYRYTAVLKEAAVTANVTVTVIHQIATHLFPWILSHSAQLEEKVAETFMCQG